MLYLTCASLVCPVGYCDASASAAMRAGISAFSETGYNDAHGEPIIGAMVEALRADLRGRDRLIALGQLALGAVDVDLSACLDWGSMPLILCTREPERPGARLTGLIHDLKVPGALHAAPRRGAHAAGGATSLVQAIGMARTMLAENDAQACLILGIDSLIDARVLSWLDQHDRLRTSQRTDGVTPGEAACLLVVSKKPLSDQHLCLHGIGLATESATVLNEEPFRAEGMKTALHGALQETGIAMHDVDFRLSDVAGESYAFEELVLAQTRLMRQVRQSQPLWHPAECIGDCGAVAGLVQVAWAGQAFHRGYAPGPVAALHMASPFGLRAAAVIASKTWRTA